MILSIQTLLSPFRERLRPETTDTTEYSFDGLTVDEERELLVRLYWKEDLTQREIRKRSDRSLGWINNRLDEYDIPTLPGNVSPETRSMLREKALEKFGIEDSA